MKMPFLLLFFILSFVLCSQAEYSLLNDDISWIQEVFAADGGNLNTTYYTRYSIDRDTVIEGLTYSIVKADGIFYACIREENGRLFQWEEDENRVLLDFNMSVGDTLFLEDCSQFRDISECPVLIVVAIDSVAIFDGTQRRRLIWQIYNAGFDRESFEGTWIDGIGSTVSLFDSWLCSEYPQGRNVSPICQQRLVCMKNSIQVLYNNTEGEVYDCNREDFVSSQNLYQLPEGAFTISPNPAQTFIFVQGNYRYSIARLILTDIVGREILDEVPITPNLKSTQLSVSSYQGGVYNLVIFAQDGRQSAHRILIN